MRNSLALVLVTACWSGSAAPPATPAKSPEAARAEAIAQARNVGILGGQGYGGLTYGGAFATLIGTGDVSSGFDDSNIYGGLLGSDDSTTATLGGSGSGSGGTGWGTIGTGKYGTIGHGSGTGSGYGVGGGQGGISGRRASVPSVSIGQPDVAGDYDKAIIRRYIKRNIQKITYCYEKELLAVPSLKGIVTAKFTIGVDGHVATRSTSGVGTEVASCVGQVIKDIEFPKPKQGAIDVSYPFTFSPAAP